MKIFWNSTKKWQIINVSYTKFRQTYQKKQIRNKITKFFHIDLKNANSDNAVIQKTKKNFRNINRKKSTLSSTNKIQSSTVQIISDHIQKIYCFRRMQFRRMICLLLKIIHWCTKIQRLNKKISMKIWNVLITETTMLTMTKMLKWTVIKIII